MNDFAVEFHNIPRDIYFNGNPHYLRALLWDKLEMVMEDQLREEKGESKFRLKFNVMPQLRIVDISFARTDMDEINHYDEMSKVKKKIKLVDFRLQSEKQSRFSS